MPKLHDTKKFIVWVIVMCIIAVAMWFAATPQLKEEKKYSATNYDSRLIKYTEYKL